MSAAEHSFDLSSVFAKNCTIFFYFGFWKPDSKFRYRTLYKLFTFSCFCLLLLFLLPQMVYMIVNGEDIREVTGTMYVFCTFFINLIKTVGIYSNIHIIKEAIRNFKENPLLQVKYSEHLTRAKEVELISNHLFVFGSFLGLGTQIFWTLNPMFQSENTLPTNGWYPFDSKVSPCFEFTSLFQNVASAFNILHTMNIDSFTINLMMETGLQCDFLKLTLENLTKFRTTNGRFQFHEHELNVKDTDFKAEMNKNLKFCIRHYIEIKRIANTIENIYRNSMATLFLGGAFIFCTIFYQLLIIDIGGPEFFYLMFFLFSMLTEQFIFCWFGNEITFKSEKIYRAVYNIPLWLDCDIKFRKMLVMFMIALRSPIIIRAGRIIPLSIGLFLNVLRTSYSYLTLLNSL